MTRTPTSLSTHIRILAAALTIGLFGAASTPALSDDGFMAIYMDNQKAASPTTAFWNFQNTSGTVPTLAPALAEDGFMAIHMDNQKINSAVARFWRTVLTASK
jgi:hypothetical protein